MPKGPNENQDVVETVLLLYMSVARIQASMTQGESSVSQLIQSITQIKKQVAEMETPNGNDNRLMEADIQQMIIALQFYDRLSQRLDNVSGALSALAELLSAKVDEQQPIEWQSLKDKILDSCAMQDESRICRLIFEGKRVNDVLKQIQSEGLLNADTQPEQSNGDALFF